MTSREFLRRYEADPTVERAELIQGVVYINARRVVIDGQEQIMPPIGNEGHSIPHFRLNTILGVYKETASLPRSVAR